MKTPSATCAECRLLLGGYVLDALEPDEAALVESHIATCADCAREREEFASLPALLDFAGAEEMAPAEPPASLEEAVLDRFAREHRARQRRTRVLRGRVAGLAARLARPLPASAAGALAAGVLAVVIALATGGGPARGEIYHAHLNGVASAAGAHATAQLVTFSQGTHVRLEVAGLRADPGAIYEVWCVRDDGAKVSAGTFRVDGRGRADVALTTAAVPSEYHRLSVERQRAGANGWTGERVLAGMIEYH
jgi:anti-sigma-K factor RskA